jgi:poly-gamma-glutamate capsule biosynthesis protein CapA/YwtB (metallophosphatase superfamily)
MAEETYMKILIRKPLSQEIRANPIIGYDGNHTIDYKVLFVGDVHLGDNYRYAQTGKKQFYMLEKYGYDYAFEKIKSLLFDSDLVIANLETPLVDIANTPRPAFSFTDDSRYIRKQGRFLHWSDVKRTPAYLKKYNITNVSLANNHMLDYGIDGFTQTLETLHKHSIRFFGAGHDKKQADRPFIETIVGGNRTFKLVVISAFEYRKEYDKHFSFYASSSKGGVNRLSIRRIANNIRKIREDNNNVYIVAYPHWGGARSYGWKTDAQTTVGHKLIDAGADIVIGHGPHNLQQIQQYKGKWIIYGIGNFIHITPGRYERYYAPPFSLALNLIFKEHKNFIINNEDAASDNEIKRYMKIYPIVTDNKLTNYQVRVVNQKEFEIVRQLLIEKNYAWEPSECDYKLGVDNIGQFIELSVR